MKRIVLTLILCICALSLWAVPAKRISFTIQQPDGTELTLTQCGDEHFHYFLTDDNVMVLRSADAFYYAHTQDGRLMPSEHLAHRSVDRSAEEQALVERLKSSTVLGHAVEQRVAARRTQQMRKSNTVPTQGDVHVPVLLLQYSDVKFSFSDAADIFDDQFNADNYKENGGYGSVREYFEDQSEGKFIPKFDIIGPVTLSQNMEYYGGNDEEGSDKRPREMVTEACKLANAQADFSKYDNDGDGYVDFLYVIYAGYGEASNVSKLANTIWPHAWYLESDLALDGVKISRYACSNELNGDEGTELCGIGTVCHEFSHCLGLPDFYPTNGSNGFGLQTWSLMHSGNYNNNSHTPCGYTAYEKEYLGWIEIEELDTATSVTLTPLSEGGKAYKIVNDANPNEFYVVENRQLTQWDEYIPAAGMLVMHIDYLASAWGNNAPNNDPYHQRVTIIPADNELTQNTLKGDTYPGTSGNTELTSTSKPAAKVYTGEFMKKDITNIADNDGTITFTFMEGTLPIPSMLEVTETRLQGFTVAWNQAQNISEYEVQLDLLEENPFILDEDFSKFQNGFIDLGGSLDQYTNLPGWKGKGIYGLDGAIRIGSATSKGVLVSPYLDCDSACFTIIYTIRKSDPSDEDPFVIMAVGDDEWNNSLYGYGLTVDDTEWASYFLVMDTIGERSYLYIDTRDNTDTPVKESFRVDIDDIYILAGDRSKELSGEDEPSDSTAQDSSQKVLPRRVTSKVKDLTKTPMAKSMAYRTDTTDNTDSIETDSVLPETKKRYYVTPIHTARTTDLTYSFENLDAGRYRASVRSVKDTLFSRYSNYQEVEIVDSMLPPTITPEIFIDNDSVFIHVDDSTATIYYTLDGTTPTAYATRYDAPFELKEKATVIAIARKEEHRRSKYIELRNWFMVDGFTYRTVSTIDTLHYLSEAYGGNNSKSYAGHITISNTIQHDTLTYTLLGIDDHAFRNATGLRSITIEGSSWEYIGDSLFHGCKNLNAVTWEVESPLAPSNFDNSSYNNLLVYIPASMEFEHPLMQSHHITAVKDGACDTIIFNYAYPFYAPEAFTAAHASYSRLFTQLTGYTESAGWEAIALPFDVEQVTHVSKGTIAPFGIETNHNFWLAELSETGFKPSTTLRANVPYIISMPNNSIYGSNSISGQVTFAADDVTIHATDDITVSERAGFQFIPTYDKISANDSVYALNVGKKHGSYAAGSVFAPSQSDAISFSAYMLPTASSQGAPLYRIQMQPDVEEVAPEFSVIAADGAVYLTLPEPRQITIYDMVGRQVSTFAGKAGVNTITHLKEGIYLIERTKVYVKR